MNTISIFDKELKQVDLKQELEYCIEYINSFWDLSSIKSIDNELKNPSDAFIRHAFGYGLNIGKLTYDATNFSRFTLSLSDNRKNYLSDVVQLSDGIIEKDSLVSLLRHLGKNHHFYFDYINNHHNGALSNYEKAQCLAEDELNKNFTSFTEIKPINSKEYAEKFDGKNLIMAYRDKMKENIDSFNGGHIEELLTFGCFPERIAISNTLYMELDQGVESYKTLIGSIVMQAYTLMEYNNYVLMKEIIDKLDLNSKAGHQCFDFELMSNKLPKINVEGNTILDILIQNYKNPEMNYQDKVILNNYVDKDYCYSFDVYTNGLIPMKDSHGNAQRIHALMQERLKEEEIDSLKYLP